MFTSRKELKKRYFDLIMERPEKGSPRYQMFVEHMAKRLAEGKAVGCFVANKDGTRDKVVFRREGTKLIKDIIKEDS